MAAFMSVQTVVIEDERTSLTYSGPAAQKNDQPWQAKQAGT
jgi:hypothetical protein